MKVKKDTTIEERCDLVCNFIREGESIKDAYTRAGLTEDSVSKRPELKRKVELAILDAKKNLIAKVYTAKDWKAALELLERRYPDEFGKKQEIPGDHEITLLVHVIRADARTKVQTELKKKKKGDDDGGEEEG